MIGGIAAIAAAVLVVTAVESVRIRNEETERRRRMDEAFERWAQAQEEEQ